MFFGITVQTRDNIVQTKCIEFRPAAPSYFSLFHVCQCQQQRRGTNCSAPADSRSAAVIYGKGKSFISSCANAVELEVYNDLNFEVEILHF